MKYTVTLQKNDLIVKVLTDLDDVESFQQIIKDMKSELDKTND